ncbi:hypothetical protein PG984_005264 [Apiospora sp. TS-2023a]
MRDTVGAGSVPDLSSDNGLDMDLVTPTCIASTTHRIVHKKKDASGFFYSWNRSPLSAGGLVESLQKMGPDRALEKMALTDRRARGLVRRGGGQVRGWTRVTGSSR